MAVVGSQYRPRISREMHIGSLHAAAILSSPHFVFSFVRALLQGSSFESLISALT